MTGRQLTMLAIATCVLTAAGTTSWLLMHRHHRDEDHHGDGVHGTEKKAERPQ